MIVYPSIDKLLENIDSRYSLAVLASKRAHEIEAGDMNLLSEYKSPRTVGMAMEEIAAGQVNVDPNSLMLEKDAERMDKLEQQENLK